MTRWSQAEYEAWQAKQNAYVDEMIDAADPGKESICLFCKNAFSKKHGLQKYCSSHCRYENWHERHYGPRKKDYAAQTKTLRAIHERQRAKRILVICGKCGKHFKLPPSAVGETNYCSRECAWAGNGEKISKALTGKKITEETKGKLRQYTKEKASSWKGGKPKCKECAKEINYESQYCSNHKHLLWTKEHWDATRRGAKEKLTGKMPKNLSKPGKFRNVKRDWYEINGVKMFFRSKWEANYALYLDFLVKCNEIKKWEYEPKAFVFHKIKFGTRSYRPDFRVTNLDGSFEYHEIKGWMTSRSQTQMKRMTKYYPEVVVILIQGTEYRSICRRLSGVLHFY